MTIQVNFGAAYSPELSLLKIFTINLPSQPFLGHHLGFHIIFLHRFFEGCTLFEQLCCFGLDFTFCICIPQSWPMAGFGTFYPIFFSLSQKEEKMKQILNTLNISGFISKCTIYICDRICEKVPFPHI